jgi:MFS family permease
VRGRLHRFGRELRGYPSQFWVLVAGIFVYVSAAALAFPYEGIYLHDVLDVSMTWIGVVFGLVPAAMVPLQIWGGQLTDRLGRRSMLIVSVCSAVLWFVGFAFVREVWQVALLVAVESSIGWPLFQTASNAMIADLLPPKRRAEGFSITRVSMNLGVVLGPALAGLALGWGASFRQLFLSAAGGCLIMLGIVVVWVRESRPASALETGRSTDAAGRSGYRIVLADRRFLIFCAVAVLPVFCIGNFGSIYSVYITGYLDVPYGTWGWLLAMNALIVAVVQYPLVRALKWRNRMVLLAVSSALLGVGIGGSAFAGALSTLVVLVMVMSLGEVLLSPVASAEVSDFAPEAVRGRYMGVWTVVWSGGAALGPAFGGWAMDAIGAREAFFVLLLVGLAGAGAFMLLAPAWRRRHGTPGPQKT